MKVWPLQRIPKDALRVLVRQQEMLCRGDINPVFFRQTLQNDTDWVLTAIRFQDQGLPIICGFALLQQQDTSLYIHLICADGPKGTGTKLLVRIFDFAREQGLTSVRLSAIDSARTFYERHGFNHTFPLPLVMDEDTESPMHRKVESRRDARARKQRERRQATRILTMEQELQAMKHRASPAVCRLVEKMRAAQKKKE